MKALRQVVLGFCAVPWALIWMCRSDLLRICLRLMLLHWVALITLGGSLFALVSKTTFGASSRLMSLAGDTHSSWFVTLTDYSRLGLSLGLGFVLAVVLVLFAAQAVAMPLLDHLSGEVEARLGRRRAPQGISWRQGLMLGVTDFVGALGLAAVLAVPQLVLAMVLPPLGAALGLLVVALGWSLEFVTLPLARRGMGYWARWRWLLSRWPATLVFGLVASSLLLSPLSLLVALPWLGVAGTWLFVGLQAPEETTAASKLTRSA